MCYSVGTLNMETNMFELFTFFSVHLKVLRSLDAPLKLLQASQHAPQSQCDYQQLIQQL